MRADIICFMDSFIISSETRVGYRMIRHKIYIKDVAVTVNTPRVLIMAASYCEALVRLSVIYLHVVVRATSRTTLQMEMIKAEVYVVAIWYSNNPNTIKLVVVVRWVIWAVEISVLAS